MQFEWDTEKAEASFKKHKIYFSEAETVFDDPLAKIAMMRFIRLKRNER